MKRRPHLDPRRARRVQRAGPVDAQPARAGGRRAGARARARTPVASQPEAPQPPTGRSPQTATPAGARVPRRGVPQAAAAGRRAAAVQAAAGQAVHAEERHQGLPRRAARRCRSCRWTSTSTVARSTDPKGKDGLASVCMAMLTEGTEKLDKIAYAEALADVASNISAYAADDSAGVTLSSLDQAPRRRRSRCSSTRCARRACAASDFDRMMKRRIEGVQAVEGHAGVDRRPRQRRGALRRRASVRRGDHRGRRSTRSRSTTARRSRARGSSRKNARLFVVGDLTEAQVRAHVRQARARGVDGRGAEAAGAAGAEDDDGPDLLRRTSRARRSRRSMLLGSSAPSARRPTTSRTR